MIQIFKKIKLLCYIDIAHSEDDDVCFVIQKPDLPITLKLLLSGCHLRHKL